MNLQSLFKVLQGRYQPLLNAFAQAFERFDAVTSASSGLELRHYESGDKIEAYVEAELATGNAVTWWMEIEPQAEGFALNVSLLLDTPAGQSSLKEGLPYSGPTAQLIMERIDTAIPDILLLSRYVGETMTSPTQVGSVMAATALPV